MLGRSRYQKSQSRSFAKRKKYRTATIAALLVVSIAAWLFFFVRLTSIDALSIDDVTVTGADPDISAVVRAAVLDSLGGKLLGLFPKSSVLMYPKGYIEKKIKGIAPRVQTVTVKPSGSRTLAVLITEKPATALICTDYPDFSDNSFESIKDDSCYYTDDNAKLFEAAPSISGDAYERYYVPSLTDSSSSTVAAPDTLIGMQSMPPPTFVALRKFYSGAKAANISVDAILVKDAGEYEMYADNIARPGTVSTSTVVIYFNDQSSFEDQLANLISFWENALTKSRAGGRPPTYDYIDIRYGSNIFYK